MTARWSLMFLSVAVVVLNARAADKPTIRIGSKSFTESVILAELGCHVARDAGFETQHISGLGGTRVLWEALLAGQIDAYVEYTGTLREEVFAGEGLVGAPALRERLADLGLDMTRPLGFNNTYAIGMKATVADELGIQTISELRNHPDLRLRFSNEFMHRGDGWQSLSARYQLPHRDVRGLEHALAYEAIESGAIDATDLYATDAKIRKLKLRRLDDDLSHFPRYDAIFVYRAALAPASGLFVEKLRGMAGLIDETAMTVMNARVELDGMSESRVAADFLAEARGIQSAVVERSLAEDITRYTLEHLQMVGVSLLAAVCLAVPLGIVSAQSPRFAQIILGFVGVIQTIPSIALLVLLIRPVSYFCDELGYPQAVVALFLYSLLPIVRNTYTGLHGMAPSLHESAVALGLSRGARLWHIELPLASRTILAGIKTAAVINVGFATLGGFIGAGGFGEPIFAGIRLNDYTVILQGAVPAAILAVVVQGLFEVVERLVVPRGLRLKPLS